MEDIFERLKTVFVETTQGRKNPVTLDDVKSTSRLKEDLDIDSLDLVQLTLSTEEAFGIEIPDDDAQNIKTVQDVMSLVEKLWQVSSQ